MEDKVIIANKWICIGYPVTKVLKILGLNKSTYYFNINKDSKIESGKDQKLISKGGRPILGSSKTTDEEIICDEQIKNIFVKSLNLKDYAMDITK